MKAYDFEYDGKNLSDIGFTVCEFNASDDFSTVSSGSQITFNTSPVLRGARHELLSTAYEECLETTFQICKDPCTQEGLEISTIEFRHLMKWLNRKKFYKFKLLEVDYMDLYFEGSFNISRIERFDKLYGLELNLITNRPWALQEPKPINLTVKEKNGKVSITDVSDEIGFIYPHMEIVVKEAGDLTITNQLENRTTTIRNCVAEEKITMDYPVIKTTMSSHKIQNDFNWIFPRIANTMKTGKNDYIVTLPCTINVVYSPIIKLGF